MRILSEGRKLELEISMADLREFVAARLDEPVTEIGKFQVTQSDVDGSLILKGVWVNGRSTRQPC